MYFCLLRRTFEMIFQTSFSFKNIWCRRQNVLRICTNLNCLNRRLVDVLKTVSYDVQFAQLFLWAKSLIGNLAGTQSWRMNRTKGRNENEEMYKEGNDHWETSFPCALCWKICVCLSTFVLSCSNNRTRLCLPGFWFCPRKHINRHVNTTYKTSSLRNEL